MNDAALLLRARGGDELAFRRLLERHDDLLEIYTKRYFAPGLSRQDLKQEARVGLHKAVRDYRPDRHSGFRNFASLCVERQVITAVKTATRHKHSPLNHAALFSTPAGEEEGATLGDLLPDEKARDPALQLVEQENLATLTARVNFELSDLERAAVIGRADGLEYEEIAEREGCSHKTIDNAMQRAKLKLSKPPGPIAVHAPDGRARSPLSARPRPVSRPPQPRRRRRHSPPAGRLLDVASHLPAKERPTMTIVQSIDAEITGIEKEIEELEAQLQPRRSRLDGLRELRDKAEALPNAEGGMPSSATPPRPKPAAKPSKRDASASNGDLSPDLEKILEAVESGKSRAGEIRSATGLSQDKTKRALQELRRLDRIDTTGARAGTRYFPKGAADRPKKAPTRERRAAPAPAPKSESRPTPPVVKPAATCPVKAPVEPLPKKPTAPPPDSPAKQAHNAMRDKVAQAIVELVADSEPITGDEITTMVLEQVPEAERSDVTAVRVRLCRAPECKLEQRADGFHLAHATSTGRTVTNAEREAVACLGSGRTAREVASNCDSIRDATSARAILEGLVRRNVIRRREGSDPAVYEAIAQEVAA